jgi:hypothetical protein
VSIPVDDPDRIVAALKRHLRADVLDAVRQQLAEKGEP